VPALDDLTTLALFAEVVDKRSFTAAAAASGMAKATVSRRIAGLERRLGVRLLQRTTRSITLTEEGQRLYDCSHRLVTTAKEATDLLSDAGVRPAGVLRVSAPVAFAHLHLTSAVVEFLRRFPDIELQLLPRSGPSDLVQQDIDVAIRVGKIADTSLVARRLATDTVVVVGSRSYLDAHGTPRAVADLEGHSVLRLSWEAQQPQWRFRGQQKRWLPNLRGNLVSSDAGVVREAAALGLGLAVLPSFIVAEEVRAGRLVRVLGDKLFADVPIQIIYAERRNLPMRVRVFFDFLVHEFATPAWRQRALLTPKR
jgi:DNA-binding transcriptional LysR family regulator